LHSRSRGRNGIRTTAPTWADRSRNQAVAIGGSGHPSLTTASTLTWPPDLVSAVMAAWALIADQVVHRQATRTGFEAGFGGG
jgi:hypothetical protein